ncbi:FmdB family zinc ribbon protein [Myxococcota bacterium]
MPTYVYECRKCGEFEEQQSIKAPAFTRCHHWWGRSAADHPPLNERHHEGPRNVGSLRARDPLPRAGAPL